MRGTVNCKSVPKSTCHWGYYLNQFMQWDWIHISEEANQTTFILYIDFTDRTVCKEHILNSMQEFKEPDRQL